MEKADDIIDYKAVGRRISAARRSKGLSQRALAAMIDISATNLSHIERGATKASLPTLMKIANSLGASMDELLSDSLIKSKHISSSEIASIIEQCSDKEAKIIAAAIKSIYEAIHGNSD